MATDILINSEGQAIITYFKKVTLTNAQIKALPSTPVVLVAAPGAGKVILPISGYLHFNIAVGYTNVGNADDPANITMMFLTSPNFGYIPSDVINPIATPSNYTQLLMPFCTQFSATDPDVINGAVNEGDPKTSNSLNPNQGISVNIDNQTQNYETNLGDFTGGDDANELTIGIYYTIVDL